MYKLTKIIISSYTLNEVCKGKNCRKTTSPTPPSPNTYIQQKTITMVTTKVSVMYLSSCFLTHKENGIRSFRDWFTNLDVDDHKRVTFNKIRETRDQSWTNIWEWRKERCRLVNDKKFIKVTK